MRFGLGNATGNLYNTTKRALVGKGNKTYGEHTAIGNTKLELETRPLRNIVKRNTVAIH